MRKRTPGRRTKRYLAKTFESSISDKGKQSEEAFNVILKSFEGIAKQGEISQMPHRLSASSTNSTKAPLSTACSISSYFKARTSASAPFLVSNDDESSSRTSTESENLFLICKLVESSSIKTAPSPASFSTRRTTPSFDPSAEVNGKRPFTIQHMITIEEYCKKRDHTLLMGKEWLELLWGFEGLQRQFKQEFKWEPDLDRFEEFEEKRKEDSEF